MASNCGENVFDEILLQVGNSGRFQKRYNIIFNLIFATVSTMAVFNVIICLAIPEHWCKVPGQEFTNFSTGEWKNRTIPLKNGREFSQCTMFNKTDSTLDFNTTIDCMYGWEYDPTYYHQTIVTEENWVCDHNLYGANFLVAGKVGEIVGTVFSQLGDIYGRKPVFYIAIVLIVVGRLGLLFSKGVYLMFLMFSFIGSLPSLSLYQAPLIVSVEMSSVEDRTSIPLFQCFGWTLGLCIAPLIYWKIGEWRLFVVVSTLPLLIFPFLQSYLIESPRWLAARGYTKRCVIELKKIAKVNRSEVSESTVISLEKESVTPEKVYGVMSVFSSWKLARTTLLVISGWICYNVVYIILFLNVSNLKGNPFLNYVWQGLAEFPGYFLGKYSCNTLGRKYTKFVGFLCMGAVSAIFVYILTYSEDTIVVSIVGIALKFVSSVVFYAINLQTIELYPTCLRQTGASMGVLTGTSFAIFAPYIIYLGTSTNLSYPYFISALLSIIGGVFSIFLPETLNERLPETISEAEDFGKDQSIWSLPKRKSLAHQHVSKDS